MLFQTISNFDMDYTTSSFIILMAINKKKNISLT